MAGIFEFAEFPDVCRLRTQLKLTPVSGGTSGEYLPPGVPVPLHHSDYPVRRTGISGSSSLLQWISVVWAVQHILFIFFLLVF